MTWNRQWAWHSQKLVEQSLGEIITIFGNGASNYIPGKFGVNHQNLVWPKITNVFAKETSKQIMYTYNISYVKNETNKKKTRYYSYNRCAFVSFKTPFSFSIVWIPCELCVLRLHQLMNNEHNLFCLVIGEENSAKMSHESKSQGERIKKKWAYDEQQTMLCCIIYTRKKIEANCLSQLALIWPLHLSCGQFTLVAKK